VRFAYCASFTPGCSGPGGAAPKPALTEYSVGGLAGCPGFGAGEPCDEEPCSLPVAAMVGLVPTDEAAFEDGVELVEPDTPDGALELAEILETVVELLVAELLEVLVEPAPGSGVNGLRELPRRCWEAPLVVSATARPAPG
jgi:hypothetical protein